MQTIFGIGQINQPLKNTAVAIGIFDGVHVGHQHLITQAVEKAKALGGQSVVITFWPHPAQVLTKSEAYPYLISLSHRLALIEKLGVDVCLVIEFDQGFANVLANDFIKDYLIDALNAKAVFVGDDFRFGKDRQAGQKEFENFAKAYGFEFTAVKRVEEKAEPISSTRLRAFIQSGDLAQAHSLFGRPVSVMGKVVKGDARGRELGYPTANIHCEVNVLIPFGVYVVEVELDDHAKYQGMANVGIRPSFEDDVPKASIEAHLFDFEGNLYGQLINVSFLHKLRDEQKFSSPEALKDQLVQDKTLSLNYLRQNQ